MPGQGVAHRLGVLLPQAGAALHVGEEEGDGAGGQVRHRLVPPGRRRWPVPGSWPRPPPRLPRPSRSSRAARAAAIVCSTAGVESVACLRAHGGGGGGQAQRARDLPLGQGHRGQPGQASPGSTGAPPALLVLQAGGVVERTPLHTLPAGGPRRPGRSPAQPSPRYRPAPGRGPGSPPPACVRRRGYPRQRSAGQAAARTMPSWRRSPVRRATARASSR